MRQWTEETEKIITTHKVNAKTYASLVGSVGYGAYVKSLGGVFARQYGHMDPITTVEQLHERIEYVSGLMYIFGVCYWNKKTWWFFKNKASESFYSKKNTSKCREGTIGEICTGKDGRTRITCCNYGVDTLLWQCGIYSLKKTTVKTKSKLVPGDVIDFYRKSDGKWHHQAVVHSIEGSKIWLADYGSRYIKTGKPLHYMSMTGTAAGGEYGSDKWIGRHRLTLKKEEVIPTLNGIDMASYQAGLDFSKVKADFAIIKATQGTSYVNPDCNRAYASAKANGVLRGLYHYASGGSAVAEADYFVQNIKNYVGDALLALDWESAQNDQFGRNDVIWCKLWLDRVYELTGVRPLIYMSQSVTNRCNWSEVAKNYGLWVAQYVVESRNGYKQDYAHGVTGAWAGPAIFQYTSGGYLTGWNNRLDLNVAYMTKEAWNKYAGKKTEEVVPIPRTIKIGSTGKVVRMWQAFLGFSGPDIDGKFGAKKTKPATIKWQKAHGLTPDGVVGPKTWEAALKSIQ